MLLKHANLLNFKQINSWFSQFITEAQNTTHSTISLHTINVMFDVVFCLNISEFQVVSWALNLLLAISIDEKSCSHAYVLPHVDVIFSPWLIKLG